MNCRRDVTWQVRESRGLSLQVTRIPVRLHFPLLILQFILVLYTANYVGSGSDLPNHLGSGPNTYLSARKHAKKSFLRLHQISCMVISDEPVAAPGRIIHHYNLQQSFVNSRTQASLHWVNLQAVSRTNQCLPIPWDCARNRWAIYSQLTNFSVSSLPMGQCHETFDFKFFSL
jgi:hypothetical protein